jgi:unconventional prefoldin RPB5 interactor 1
VYERRLLESEGRLRQYQQFKDEYRELDTTLAHLLTKPRHQVMVPMGPKAFMPGHLKDTNNITVLLGDNYFAERSVKQAREVIRRRFAELKRLDGATRAEMAQFEGSLSTSEEVFKDGSGQVVATTDKGTATTMADGVVEIREDYDSEDEGKGAPDEKEEPDWAGLTAMMEKMEAEEAQAEWAGDEPAVDAQSSTSPPTTDAGGGEGGGDTTADEEEGEDGEEEEFDEMWNALGTASLEQRAAEVTEPEFEVSTGGMSPTNIRSPSDMYEFMKFAKENADKEEPVIKSASPVVKDKKAPASALKPKPAATSAPVEAQPVVRERHFENPAASTTSIDVSEEGQPKKVSAFKARRLAQR